MCEYMKYLLKKTGSNENSVWFINWNLRRTYVRKEFVKRLVEKLRERDGLDYKSIEIINGLNGMYVPQIVVGDDLSEV